MTFVCKLMKLQYLYISLTHEYLNNYGVHATKFSNQIKELKFMGKYKKERLHVGELDNVPKKGHNITVKKENWLSVVFYGPAQKEILTWPIEIKKDLGSILTKLQKGENVGEPDTKSMKSVASGCFEIRLKGADGIYRAFYILKTEVGILVFHSFKKKSQKTPVKEIDTGKTRLKALLKELGNEE